MNTSEMTIERTPDAFLPLGVGKVRYKRVGKNRVPKNAFYTLTHGNFIYFGIARCRLKTDVCQKSEGLAIARERAMQALQRHKGTSVGFALEPGWMAGKVEKERLDIALNYFYSLDSKQK